MKFKIGDAVIDLRVTAYGTGLVELIENDQYYIRFEYNSATSGHHRIVKGLMRRSKYDEHHLEEDLVYNSPLMKALR